MNFWFDANFYNSIFSKNAIKNPALAEKYLATWRDINGIIHHDILHAATTNNQAEYGSLLQVLRHIRKEAESEASYWAYPGKIPWIHKTKPTEMIIYGDSQLVIYQLNGKYKVKEEELKPLWLEAINLVHVLKTEFNVTVTFQWVRREINNEALNIKGKVSLHDPEIEKIP